MIKKETIEAKKLIAKFWGYKTFEEIQTLSKEDLYLKNWYYVIKAPNGDYTQSSALEVESLKFDRSWDWIIPVLEKIRNTKETTLYIDEVTLSMKSCFIKAYPYNRSKSFCSFNVVGDVRGRKRMTLKDCAFLTIAEFLTWYYKNI